VLEINGPDEYADVRAHQPQRLVVLMCKARSCRPCKAFSRKYGALAAKFKDRAIFLEIYGDDSRETRQMMISMAVKATPTFRLTRGPDQEVGALTGTSDAKLRDAVVEAMSEDERALLGSDELEAWRRSKEAALEAEALEAATEARVAAAAASAASSSAEEEAA
jgi:thiol-disulfide isomerase/thioredoxin